MLEGEKFTLRWSGPMYHLVSYEATQNGVAFTVQGEAEPSLTILLNDPAVFQKMHAADQHLIAEALALPLEPDVGRKILEFSNTLLPDALQRSHQPQRD